MNNLLYSSSRVCFSLSNNGSKEVCYTKSRWDDVKQRRNGLDGEGSEFREEIRWDLVSILKLKYLGFQSALNYPVQTLFRLLKSLVEIGYKFSL